LSFHVKTLNYSQLKIEKNCPICKSSNFETIKENYFESKDRGNLNRRNQLLLEIYAKNFNESLRVTVVQCDVCGFIWTNPRLNDDDLALKYRKIEEFDLGSRKGPPPNLADRRRRTSTLATELLGPKKGARILDYGGAEGFLLSPLIELGHKGFVSDYIDYPKEDDRIVFVDTDLSGMVQGYGPYDLIFILHTLEHVGNPVSILKKLADMLTDDGYIYAEVPLGAWIEWEVLREPMTHVNFFSEESFSRAVYEAGLQVETLDTQWQYVTHQEKTVCVNMVVRKLLNEKQPTLVKKKAVKKQMHALSQGLAPFKSNFRYYAKVIAKSLLRR
jgi:2-polyprenyl-3-methyl-5-hydroxy-6-metoxy-1,4-benzoquinol methylase